VDFLLQLGLNKRRKPDSDNQFVTAIWLIDRLLELISDNASDGDNARNSAFRSILELPKKEILKSHGDKVAGRAAQHTLDLCRQQFEASHNLRLERDENFAEIILFLRKSLMNLSGDSQKYHDSLMGTAERIGRLSDLKDIQELKSRVAAEVTELNRIVEEKQKRDRTQYTELSEQVVKLQTKLEKAKAEASMDGLTGIANRRRFDMMIQRWILAHEKNEEPFTIALFDLDNFKQINDTFGHQTGDQVLASIAGELGSKIRSCDFLARYGGEEFVILSEGMQVQESEARYSEMLDMIAGTPIKCRDNQNAIFKVTLTASCGVAGYALGESAKDLISRADEALYEAKKLGKNRVAIKRRPLLSAFYEGRKIHN
jgi:diguanylate cyclase (GGDEF)-like protein